MTQYIDKSVVVAEIRGKINSAEAYLKYHHDDKNRMVYSYKHQILTMCELLSFLDTLEVNDPYEQCVQYPSIKDGIQAHAETYSFNIESELFNQLTKEQQALWRKEIEQAYISGGNAGVELARDFRYKENLKVKEVDLEKEINLWVEENTCNGYCSADIHETAEHFFELGLKTQKGK